MIPLGLDPRRWSLAPYTALLVAWVAMCWAAGVSVADVGRYATYEAAFVLVPGVLAAAALLPHLRPGILLFAIGAGLGLALELAAYIATAAVGQRSMFVSYPFIVMAVALVVIRRQRGTPRGYRGGCTADDGEGRRDRSASSGPAGAWHASVVAIALVAVGVLALGLFPLTPAVTPGNSPVYHQDLIYNVSIAAELERRIPPTLPQVAGLPLVYHWFANAHLAAVASVTGVDLWTLVSRLFPTAWLAIAVVQVAAVGSAISGRKWVGPLAASIVILSGELDLSLAQAIPFNGTFRSNLWQSPSFLFGLTVYMPTILLLAPGAPRTVRWPLAGRWIVATALVAACLGAKATILPVLVGGGLFAVALAWLRQRRAVTQAAGATILAGGLLVLGSMTLYLGGQTGFVVAPLASITRTPAWRLIEEAVRSRTIGPLGDVVLGAVVLGALLAPIGGALLLDRRRAPLAPRTWLAGLLLAALAAYLLFDHPGVSQLYFLHYGVVAGAILGAWAVVDVARQDPAAWRSWRWRLAVVALATALAAAATAVIAPNLAMGPVVVFWAPYAVLVAAAGTFATVAAFSLPRARRRFLGTALVGAVLGTSALDTPFDLGDRTARVLAGDPIVQQDGPDHRGVTSDLLEGLRWIRDNAEPDAIVAVNNPYLRPGRDPRSFLVSAFAERRVFLEGWAYSAEAQVVAAERLQDRTVDEPFADRRATNMAVFERADLTAAGALRAAGVGYLFVDRWAPAVPLDGIATLVFENLAVRIYRLATID